MAQTIRIRYAGSQRADWLTFFVEGESTRNLTIDNRRTDYLGCRTLLLKRADGTLVNGAGQAFEVHPDDQAARLAAQEAR